MNANTEHDEIAASLDLSLSEVAALLIQLRPGDLREVVDLQRRLAQIPADGACADALVRCATLLDALLMQERPFEAIVEEVGVLLEQAMEGVLPEAERRSVAAAPGAAEVAPLIDAELIPDFIHEALDFLQSAEAALLRLEAEPGDRESLNTVFRAFHTIKGTAAFLGLDEIADLAHSAESMLSEIRSGVLAYTPERADLALRSADMLRGLVEGVRATLAGASAPAVTAPAGALEGSAAADAPALLTSPSPAPADSAGTERDAAIRIRTDRLDRLMDLVGELVVAQAMVAQDPGVATPAQAELARKVQHAGKIVRDLQDLSTSLRMVPLRSTFQKVSRLVRDLARRSGKQVELLTFGEDTEVDRSMADLIGDPLVHMVRNAVDHGIERPEERLACGKPAHGTLRLSAYHSGGNVVVELSDDGRGLQRERILARAVGNGLIAEDRALSDREVYNLIFLPGFSTAETITDVSGRGVGMDVVKRNVEALRGRIEIDSVPGEGTTFGIRLPLTLSIIDGMLARVGSERYVVPGLAIHMCFRPESHMLSSVFGRGEAVLLHGEVVPIVRLHRVFSIEGAEPSPTQGILVVIGEGESRTALLVDELLGKQQFVVKPLGAGIGRVMGVAGGAVLGDGSIGLILEPSELIALAEGRGTGSGEPRAAAG